MKGKGKRDGSQRLCVTAASAQRSEAFFFPQTMETESIAFVTAGRSGPKHWIKKNCRAKLEYADRKICPSATSLPENVHEQRATAEQDSGKLWIVGARHVCPAFRAGEGKSSGAQPTRA